MEAQADEEPDRAAPYLVQDPTPPCVAILFEPEPERPVDEALRATPYSVPVLRQPCVVILFADEQKIRQRLAPDYTRQQIRTPHRVHPPGCAPLSQPGRAVLPTQRMANAASAFRPIPLY